MSADVIRLPLQADHPSWFIQEELDERGWTLDELAKRMGGDFGHNRLTLDMYFIVGPTRTNMRLGQETADQLSLAFGASAQFFLNLEAAWLRSHPDTKATQ